MNGILLVNKPINMTSRDVVNKVSHILHTKKIGHTGTLDPLASGVMVLIIGKATKIGELITAYDKEYIAEVTLGLETDTLDLEGTVIKEEKVSNITVEQINQVLQSFIGPSKQEVPKYSAVKVNGKKLYEYARANINVALPVKDINIYKLELLGDLIYQEDKIKFKVLCHVSKGTYIRSLARDIGHKLNTIACMSSLERIKQGNYTIEQCYSLEDIKNNNYKLISLHEALKHLPMIKINKDIENQIRNGAVIDRFFEEEMAVLIDDNNDVIAIYQVYNKDNTKVKPYKMLFSE